MSHVYNDTKTGPCSYSKRWFHIRISNDWPRAQKFLEVRPCCDSSSGSIEIENDWVQVTELSHQVYSKLFFQVEVKLFRMGLAKLHSLAFASFCGGKAAFPGGGVFRSGKAALLNFLKNKICFFFFYKNVFIVLKNFKRPIHFIFLLKLPSLTWFLEMHNGLTPSLWGPHGPTFDYCSPFYTLVIPRTRDVVQFHTQLTFVDHSQS